MIRALIDDLAAEHAALDRRALVRRRRSATAGGTVSDVGVVPGEQVNAGDLIVVLDETGSPA